MRTLDYLAIVTYSDGTYIEFWRHNKSNDQYVCNRYKANKFNRLNLAHKIVNKHHIWNADISSTSIRLTYYVNRRQDQNNKPY